MFLAGIGNIVQIESPDQADDRGDGYQCYHERGDKTEHREFVVLEIQVDLEQVEDLAFHFTLC